MADIALVSQTASPPLLQGAMPAAGLSGETGAAPAGAFAALLGEAGAPPATTGAMTDAARIAATRDGGLSPAVAGPSITDIPTPPVDRAGLSLEAIAALMRPTIPPEGQTTAELPVSPVKATPPVQPPIVVATAQPTADTVLPAEPVSTDPALDLALKPGTFPELPPEALPTGPLLVEPAFDETAPIDVQPAPTAEAGPADAPPAPATTALPTKSPAAALPIDPAIVSPTAAIAPVATTVVTSPVAGANPVTLEPEAPTTTGGEASRGEIDTADTAAPETTQQAAPAPVVAAPSITTPSPAVAAFAVPAPLPVGEPIVAAPVATPDAAILPLAATPPADRPIAAPAMPLDAAMPAEGEVAVDGADAVPGAQPQEARSGKPFVDLLASKSPLALTSPDNATDGAGTPVKDAPIKVVAASAPAAAAAPAPVVTAATTPVATEAQRVADVVRASDAAPIRVTVAPPARAATKATTAPVAGNSLFAAMDADDQAPSMPGIGQTGTPATATAAATSTSRGFAQLASAATAFAARISGREAATTEAMADPAAAQNGQLTTALPQQALPQTTAQVQAAAQPQTPVAVPIPLPRLAEEIVQRANAGDTRFEIRLDPAELGRIDVRLELDEAGEARAHLEVERRETYELITRDQRQLERTLREAGFEARDGAVSVSLRQGGGEGERFANQQQNQQQGRQGGDHSHSRRDLAAADITDSSLTRLTEAYRPATSTVLDVRI